MQKYSSGIAVFFTLAVILLVMGVVVAGCIADDTTNTTKANKTPTAKPKTTTKTPTPTETTTTVVKTVPTTIPITADSIKKHFMDITFGGGNSVLERLPSTGKFDVSILPNTDKDEEFIEDFLVEFNGLSSTAKLFENVKYGSQGFIKIRFVTPTGLEFVDLSSNQTTTMKKAFVSGGVLKAKVLFDTIYINQELKGEERNHTILRSLLYELGFKGESYAYPDSVFYFQDNTNANLTFLDQKAIEIMYGSALRNGMRADTAKAAVG
jgi:hypothetical protein